MLSSFKQLLDSEYIALGHRWFQFTSLEQIHW